MNREYFFAQDPAGNLQKVHRVRPPTEDGTAAAHAAVYALDDGSQVRRIDNETFQVVDTGAYVTVVRE